MNKNITKLFATIIFAAMLVGTMPMIMPAKAIPTQGFYITPTTEGFFTNTTSVGFKFNVTVNIIVTVNTFSWQAVPTWNTSHIKADRTDFTGSGKSLWLTAHSGVTPVSSPIDNTTNPGTLMMGEALSGIDSKAQAAAVCSG